jgi:hypothetical protein
VVFLAIYRGQELNQKTNLVISVSPFGSQGLVGGAELQDP